MNIHAPKIIAGPMTLAVAALIALSTAPTGAAQDGDTTTGRPKPAQAQSQRTSLEARAQNGSRTAQDARSTRREVAEGKVTLAFNEVRVIDTIPFIVEATGKAIHQIGNTLGTRKITLINDEPIDRGLALDLLFSAFLFADVAVVERDDTIVLGSLSDGNFTSMVPVIPADVRLDNRVDVGSVVVKIFPLTEALADGVSEQLDEILPDYAKMTVDGNSNQIVLMADIALCQRVQEMIDELDRNYMQEERRTFKLDYADATEVQNNILDLFEDSGTNTASNRGRTSRTQQPQRRGVPQATTPGAVTPTTPLKLTVNIPQNTISVIGERKVVDEIDRLIEEFWDFPLPEGTQRVYQLEFTDPIKIRTALQELLGQGGGTNARQAAQGNRGGAGGDVSQILGSIYRIEAYPDSNSIIVLAKTEASLNYLDDLIDKMDVPSDSGLPMVIPLKHADAFQLAEEINVLLAQQGATVTLRAPEEGLSGLSLGSFSEGGGGDGGEDTAGREVQLPWQSNRPSTQNQEQSDESPLIGKTRVVPISRRNALAVLCPPAMRDQMRVLIEEFDLPGRQVRIAAVIAEVQLDDGFALGMRVSSSGAIVGGSPDFRINGGASFTGIQNDVLGGLFDTSVLNVGVDVNLVLQALAERTTVRVLQSPSVFTADNEEAQFFDGQEVPLLTGSQTTDVGTVNETVDYESVGIFLNARPRITDTGNVDLDIYLELSSVVPDASALGSFIIDRRVTETHVVLKDRQTIVLSGILTDTESEITRKIPFLGDIPIIGELFKHRENSRQTTELIAFITPIVVNSPDDNDTNFNEAERQRLLEISKPLDAQRQNQKEAAANIRERIIPDDAARDTEGAIDDK